MKQIFTLITCAASLVMQAQAPSLSWAHHYGSNNAVDSDQGRSVTADAAGNTYEVGVFNNTGIFGTQTLTASGYDNMFLTKRDASGNIAWIARSTKTTYVLDVATDASGNVYTTGYFSQAAPNAFGSITMSNYGYEDGFVTKCDASGNFVWAKNFGGTNNDAGNTIAVDASGNIYVAGYYKGASTFGTFTLSTAFGNQEAFLAKYDASGNVVWVKPYGGSGADEVLEMCTDATGNIYTVGTFSNTATFGTYSLTSTATGGKRNVFVVKSDTSGNATIANKLDLNSGDYYYDGYDYGIAVDGTGNLYIAGTFQGTATFGATTFSTSTNFGDTDAFLTKLDASGAISWAKRYGFNFADKANALTCDAAGNAYLTGVYSGTVNFGGTSLPDGGTFVLKTDPAGSTSWVKRIGEGGYAYTIASGIALSAANDVFLTGSYRYRIIVGNDTVPSSGANDKEGFIMKLGGSGSSAGIFAHNENQAFQLFPNPASHVMSIRLDNENAGHVKVMITDLYGKTVTEIEGYVSESDIDLRSLNAGIYVVHVLAKDGSRGTGKIIKQ